jgi:hypothetical protein
MDLIWLLRAGSVGRDPPPSLRKAPEGRIEQSAHRCKTAGA